MRAVPVATLKASRNDPCPCGSGKKYKACCMTGDMARERVRAVVGDELFEAAEAEMRALADEQRTWEGDVMPIGTRKDEGAVVLLTAGPLVVHVEVLPYRPAGAEERAVTLAQALSAAGRAGSTLPQTLHVRDEEVAAALEPLLRARGIGVQAADLPGLDEAVQAVMSGMGVPEIARRLTTPDTWRETGASAQELAAFHEAAAAFYRLAPWDEPATQRPLLLELPDETPWAASVMGDGGVAYGLALYSQPADMITLMMTGEPGTMQGSALTVDYDQRGPLTAAMLREIKAAGWPIAGARAHPRLFGLNLPGDRVQAEHVRTATLCLRAVNALVRGDDPVEETEVRVSGLPLPFDNRDEEWDEWEDDDSLGWFRTVPFATPICAEGPGADPPAALRGWEDADAIHAAELERLPRLEAWLRDHIQEARKADLENARHWCEYLAMMGLPAGAVTEYDLRLYIYDLFIRKTDPSGEAVDALRTSFIAILRYFEEQEGIVYPFAHAVLDELREVETRAEQAAMSLRDALLTLSYEVYDDLDLRVMNHARDEEECVGWPDMMSPAIAVLDRELQRRWLLWYDELVRAGTTDFEALEQALLERQRAWEQAPHPAHDGRTPAEVIRAYVEQEDPAG